VLVSPYLRDFIFLSLRSPAFSIGKDTTHPTSCKTYLQVRHISVALLGTGVIRQLHVPETWELVDKEGILLDDCIEDILADKTRKNSWISSFYSEVISTAPRADCPSPPHRQNCKQFCELNSANLAS